MNMDKLIKIVSLVSSDLVLPVLGWIWHTEMQMVVLQEELDHSRSAIVVLDRKIEEGEQNSRSIISIETDIEYMKATLTRIENLVGEK